MVSIRILSLSLAALTLAACPNETPIQQKFLRDRSLCQNTAEMRMEMYPTTQEAVNQQGSVSAGEQVQNSRLIELYSGCMRQRNWAVGKAPEDANKKEEKKE